MDEIDLTLILEARTSKGVTITVRSMREKELDEVLAIARRNFMYVPKKKALSLYSQGVLKVMLAVLSTDNIVGTLWIIRNEASSCSLISGITLKNPNDDFIKYLLFEKSRSLFQEEIYYNIPTSLESYFLTLPYLKRGYLHLYIRHSSKTELPQYKIAYLVEKSEGGYEDGVCYTVKEADNTLGKGVLTYSEGQWMIGPLFARNQLVLKLLLMQFLREVRTSQLEGIMSIYVNYDYYGYSIGVLREFGFDKHPALWIRYCSIESRSEIFYDFVNQYYLECITLGTF